MQVEPKAVAASVAVLAFAVIVVIWPVRPSGESRPRAAPAPVGPIGATQQVRRIELEAAKAPRPKTVGGIAASLRSRVDRLLAPGTPRDRYLAFGVLAQCARAIEFDRYLKSLPADRGSTRLRERYGDGSARIAAACGDLSARQVDQRVELAASAADEGIPGAATAWVEEGPYGDRTALTQRPDDPLIVEWAQEAITRVSAATKRADTEAISQFGLLCLNWEMDDVARVRLLVNVALERRHEDQINRILN